MTVSANDVPRLLYIDGQIPRLQTSNLERLLLVHVWESDAPARKLRKIANHLFLIISIA